MDETIINLPTTDHPSIFYDFHLFQKSDDKTFKMRAPHSKTWIGKMMRKKSSPKMMNEGLQFFSFSLLHDPLPTFKGGGGEDVSEQKEKKMEGKEVMISHPFSFFGKRNKNR